MSTYIFIMNPNWFQAEMAFRELPNNQVDWGTNLNNVSQDDKVLIYFSTPDSKIKILTKVVKQLDDNDEIINDSAYITEEAPDDIRNPRNSINPVRLELLKFIPESSNLDLHSFQNNCNYRGRFMSDFCLDNSGNLQFKNHIQQGINNL